MLIKESDLQKIIRDAITESKKEKSKGTVILLSNDSNVIGYAYKALPISKKWKNNLDMVFKQIPTGHASAIIITGGKAHYRGFGAGACKKKNLGMLEKLGAAFGDMLGFPFMFCYDTIGGRTLGNYDTDISKSTAKMLIKKTPIPGDASKLQFAVYKNVNGEAALRQAGKVGECRWYCLIPQTKQGSMLKSLGSLFGQKLTYTGIMKRFGILEQENCGSYALEIMLVSKGLGGTGTKLKGLSSPLLMVSAAVQIIKADVRGTITV